MNIKGKIEKIFNFEGPIAATPTLYHENGSVNYSIEKFADYLSKIGVCGVYLHGTMGEGISMNNEEKKNLSKAWQSLLLKKYFKWLAIFNVSATCFEESIDQAKFCNKIGVDAIAILPPFYYRPANDDELIEYLKSIAMNAPNTPLIYYHFPEMTNVHLNLKKFITKAQQKIPQFVGMKYTSTDVANLSRFICQDELTVNKFKIFSAYEETIIPMYILGVKASICSCFNFAEIVDLYNQMRKTFTEDPKNALTCQAKINTFTENLTIGASRIYNIKTKLDQYFVDKKMDILVGKPRPPIMG